MVSAACSSKPEQPTPFERSLIKDRDYGAFEYAQFRSDNAEQDLDDRELEIKDLRIENKLLHYRLAWFEYRYSVEHPHAYPVPNPVPSLSRFEQHELNINWDVRSVNRHTPPPDLAEYDDCGS
jgi:hypothetical protein